MLKKAKRLPNKLSALILVALADLRKAERSKRYQVHMEEWHVPNGVCKVCFAGVVMAFSLRVPRDQAFSPYSFPEWVQQKMLALNAVRVGSVVSALTYLGRPYYQLPCELWNVKVPEYGSVQFHKTLRDLAAKLKEAGE